MGIALRPVAYLYPEERKYLSLDGEWLFQEDPIGIGEEEHWSSPELKRIFQRVARVPLPWQAQFPDLANYAGAAWYARSFTLPEDAQFAKAILDFTAVDHEATIWLNGSKVGHHVGGYSRFNYEVSELLRPGEENYLVVRVFDPKNTAAIPHGKQGAPWYQSVSGIWGSVYLEFLRSSTIISDVLLTPRSMEGDVDIRVQIKRLADRDSDKAFRMRCIAGNGTTESVLVNDEAIILPRKNYLRSFSFSGRIENATHWTPNTPQLFKVKAILFEISDRGTAEGTILDSLSLECGLRLISIINRQICLNGRPIVLRGVLDQGYNPKTLYTPQSEEFIKAEITAMKKLGMNLIRKHVKVEDPRYLYWCDHLGMLYWAESPNFTIPTIKTLRIFKETLANMVVRDRNHPCVIIWGIFNEEKGIWGAWFGIWNRIVRRLYSLVKQLDPTRLIVDNSGRTHVITDLNDYHHYFIAPDSDYFWTRQLRAMQRFPRLNFNRTRGRQAFHAPQVISEYGCGGISDLAWMGPISEGSEPYWYRHNGQKKRLQGIVIPYLFTSRFEKLRIARLFGTLKEFAAKSQWREFTSNKFVTEEIRRLNFAGYVLTQLSDIEWEYNGLLQYDRSPKVFNNHYSIFNGDDLLIIRPQKRVFLAGEVIQLHIFLSSFSDVRVEAATLRWQIPAFQISGEARVIMRKYKSFLLHETQILLPPACPSLLNTPINAQLVTNSGSIIAQNFEPVSIISQNILPANQLAIQVQIYDPEEHLSVYSSKWSAQGFRIKLITKSSSWDRNLPCIATTVDKQVLTFMRSGGKVLYSVEFRLPPREKLYTPRKARLIHRDFPRTLLSKYFSAKKVPGLPVYVQPNFRGDSWDGMFSLLFADPQLYHPLPFQNPLNWESTAIWPDFRLKLARYVPLRNVLVGMIFGWANTLYPLVLKLNVGRGTIIISTLNLLQNIAENPIASVIFSNILWDLKKGS